MAEVIWTDTALAHVEAITAYVSAFRPLAARALAERLLTLGDSLADSPDRGRGVSNGRRDLTAVSPYVVRYRVVGDTVFILEVLHGARLSGMEEEPSLFDVEDEAADEAADREAIEDAGAGRVISHEAAKAWLLSWGTPNELPTPKVGD